MQPYFLPYIGYWQLINAVDEYVIYDDVNFIKGGWINRNRFLIQGKAKYFNVQMKGASSFKKINEVLVDDSSVWRKNLLSTFSMAYKKAPYFLDVFPLIEEIVSCQEDVLSTYVINSILKISKYLNIDTRFLISSNIEKNYELHGQDRVLDICKRLRATSYYNAMGGEKIYSRDIFIRNNIELFFLEPDTCQYRQYKNDFVENLSILDVMMFNPKEDILRMLAAFKLK